MKNIKILTIKKAKDNLESIKSNYILQKIFVYLKKKKTLDIIKHNKKMQKRKSFPRLK